MLDPARSLYEALRALEHRAAFVRRKSKLPSSRREAAAVTRQAPYWVDLDSRRISSWLPAQTRLRLMSRGPVMPKRFGRWSACGRTGPGILRQSSGSGTGWT